MVILPYCVNTATLNISNNPCDLLGPLGEAEGVFNAYGLDGCYATEEDVLRGYSRNAMKNNLPSMEERLREFPSLRFDSVRKILRCSPENNTLQPPYFHSSWRISDTGETVGQRIFLV